MKKNLQWFGAILIIIVISILMMLHESPNETESIKKSLQNTSISPKTATIRGEIVEIYNLYEYCLVISSKEGEYSTLYEVTVPESDKSTAFELGDIVTVSYDGFVYDTCPRKLNGIISIEIE